MAEQKTAAENDDAGEGSEKTTETTEVTVESLSGRIKELSDKLASEGRSKAQIKAATEALTAERDTLKSALAQERKRIAQIEEWYYTQVAPEEDRVKYARIQDAKRLNESQGEIKKSQVLEIILDEDDPDIRKALRDAVSEAADEGEPMGPAAVRNLRKQLAKAGKSEKKSTTEQDPTQEQEKEPPLVSGTRGTGNKSVTLEDQLAEAKAKKDGVAVVNILSQIAARNQHTRGV